MNFFGHAWIACRVRPEPAFVLGSMLPDLLGMAGVAWQHVQKPSLAAGVAFHHETDQWFHDGDAFIELCSAGRRDLQRGGLGRGSAWAAAHVGIELLLDGELGTDTETVGHYRRALTQASDTLRGTSWRGDSIQRLLAVIDRLIASPLPGAYQVPSHVAQALIRILARRPRLAVDGKGLETLAGWATQVQPQVQRLKPALTGGASVDVPKADVDP